MDPRDQALQAVTPTHMVPRFGAFESLQHSGHRFLVADDGLWLEVHRPWLHVAVPLAEQHQVAMPYGRMKRHVELTCGPIPLDLLQQFSQQAREAAPLEAAAWIVWDEHTGQFAYKTLQADNATVASIDFQRPRLGDGEHLVLDLHSHGRFGAWFSSTDDRDDRGEVKIAMVLGHCDKDRPSTAIRLCLNGTFLALSAVSTADGAITFEEQYELHHPTRST